MWMVNSTWNVPRGLGAQILEHIPEYEARKVRSRLAGRKVYLVDPVSN